METIEYILRGGSGHARVVLDTLQSNGIRVRAIFDPRFTGELYGVPYVDPYEKTIHPEARCIIAIGDNATRKKVVASTFHDFGKVIHSSVLLSGQSTVGAGSMILHGAIIQASTTIGQHVIVNTGARADHDNRIGDFAHLGPGSVLCGDVQVGEGAFVGAGAVVIPGIRIGAWSVIGAGSVIIRDVPDGAVVAGNPAQKIHG